MPGDMVSIQVPQPGKHDLVLRLSFCGNCRATPSPRALRDRKRSALETAGEMSSQCRPPHPSLPARFLRHENAYTKNLIPRSNRVSSLALTSLTLLTHTSRTENCPTKSTSTTSPRLVKPFFSAHGLRADKAGMADPGRLIDELGKLNIEQLKQLKEQYDSELSVLQDSLSSIRNAATRFEMAAKAVHQLSLQPSGNNLSGCFPDQMRLPFAFQATTLWAWPGLAWPGGEC